MGKTANKMPHPSKVSGLILCATSTLFGTTKVQRELLIISFEVTIIAIGNDSFCVRCTHCTCPCACPLSLWLSSFLFSVIANIY